MNETSPIKHQLRGLSGNYESASARERKQKEGIIPKFNPKVRKVESEDEDSNFECYNKSNGKPLHVDVDKQTSGSDERNSTLVVLLNRREENKINNNGEIGVGSKNLEEKN